MGKDNERMEQLLECLVHTIGRIAMPLDKVQEIVGTRSNSQIKAFNLLNGNLTQTDVAKKAKLDKANLNKAIIRWIENGIVFRLGGDQKAPLMHIYPIPNKPSKKSGKTKPKRKK
jgi:predicted transcriptional regulator